VLTTFLFDLDGTLLDSVELILRSYKYMLKQHRGIEGTDQQWLRGLGTPLTSQLKQFTDDPQEVAAMIETYRVYNFEHHDRLAKPYDGVVDEVRHLDRLGKTIAIVTSKYRRGTMMGLKLLGLEDCIDFIVPADEVTNPKPHPEPVLKALAISGAAADETVFIGDSRHDMECGRDAGVKIAAVLWGPFDRAHLADLEPDYWLERPADLRLLTGPLTPDT
jgi:pyrophosphatase PpaX